VIEIENALPSEHDPDQAPELGQLQLEVQLTAEGVRSQVTPETLFVTRSAPPLITRDARLAPVTVMSLVVEVVKSKRVAPVDEVNTRRIPSFEKANVPAEAPRVIR
jgi:hypothetical protein